MSRRHAVRVHLLRRRRLKPFAHAVHLLVGETESAALWADLEVNPSEKTYFRTRQAAKLMVGPPPSGE